MFQQCDHCDDSTIAQCPLCFDEISNPDPQDSVREILHEAADFLASTLEVKLIRDILICGLLLWFFSEHFKGRRP